MGPAIFALQETRHNSRLRRTRLKGCLSASIMSAYVCSSRCCSIVGCSTPYTLRSSRVPAHANSKAIKRVSGAWRLGRCLIRWRQGWHITRRLRGRPQTVRCCLMDRYYTDEPVIGPRAGHQGETAFPTHSPRKRSFLPRSDQQPMAYLQLQAKWVQLLPRPSLGH